MNGSPPRALTILVAIHAIATAVAALVIAAIVSDEGDVRRPDWLAPPGRAVVAAVVLLVVYAVITWLLSRRRRAGLLLAAIVAVLGMIAAVVGLNGPLFVNVLVLALVVRPSVRAAVH